MNSMRAAASEIFGAGGKETAVRNRKLLTFGRNSRSRSRAALSWLLATLPSGLRLRYHRPRTGRRWRWRNSLPSRFLGRTLHCRSFEHKSVPLAGTTNVVFPAAAVAVHTQPLVVRTGTCRLALPLQKRAGMSLCAGGKETVVRNRKLLNFRTQFPLAPARLRILGALIKSPAEQTQG